MAKTSKFIKHKGRAPYEPGMTLDRIARESGINQNVPDKEAYEEKKQRIKEDSKQRVKINDRIKELRAQGFPKEETLTRIKKEFPDSEHKGFFESWVEHAYSKRKGNNEVADRSSLKELRAMDKESEGEER